MWRDFIILIQSLSITKCPNDQQIECASVVYVCVWDFNWPTKPFASFSNADVVIDGRTKLLCDVKMWLTETRIGTGITYGNHWFWVHNDCWLQMNLPFYTCIKTINSIKICENLKASLDRIVCSFVPRLPACQPRQPFQLSKKYIWGGGCSLVHSLYYGFYCHLFAFFNCLSLQYGIRMCFATHGMNSTCAHEQMGTEKVKCFANVKVLEIQWNWREFVAPLTHFDDKSLIF